MFNFLVLCLSIFKVNAYSLIALTQQNINILTEAFNNVSDPSHYQYSKYWSESQINELISPSERDMNNLFTYLNNNNINCIRKGGDALKCDNFNDKCLKDIPDTIEFIETSDYQVNNYSPRSAWKSEDNSGFVGREVMISLYNITHNKISNNMSVCAVEYQNAGGFNNSDLLIQQTLNCRLNNLNSNIF